MSVGATRHVDERPFACVYTLLCPRSDGTLFV